MKQRDIDFIVIGAQKAGTTSLWKYLSEHPRIAMPSFKEAPIFCMTEERVQGALEQLMESGFGEVAPDAVLGKVATYYMMGFGSVDVERVVDRIHGTWPEVRLLALLRDPVERAISHYKMSVRRGFESRTFDALVDELLEPGQLERARAQPSETNSYLVQGEYGRILRSYRRRFPAERIHVEMSADLESEPAEVVSRILAFLGLPADSSLPGLDVRHHLGGTERRLDAAAEAALVAFMEEQVWPRLGEDAMLAKGAFAFFLETWNVIPDDSKPSLSSANRARLESYFRADAEILGQIGVVPVWLADWDADR